MPANAYAVGKAVGWRRNLLHPGIQVHFSASTALMILFFDLFVIFTGSALQQVIAECSVILIQENTGEFLISWITDALFSRSRLPRLVH